MSGGRRDLHLAGDGPPGARRIGRRDLGDAGMRAAVAGWQPQR